VKKYDELRYQLLPYTYTLAWEARQSGMPLIRALWLHYPDDPIARGMGSEYLWGRDLLIAPVFKKGVTTWDVYLPKGMWYDWWNNKLISGGTTIHRAVDLSTMPIYVRAGAIIPFDPIRQYTAEPVSEPTTLRIYPGADGDFTLYEDDGISQDYLQGKASWIHLTWKDNTHTLKLSPGAPEGFTSQPVHRTFKVRLMTGSQTRTVKYDGEAVNVRL
jgi:alpha-glucosidase/alpha-D-xyloside xylohydrolase